MTAKIEKTLVKEPVNVSSNLEIGIYSIYDCVLKQFGAPISIPVSKVNDYFTLLVNDDKSPYFNHESDYILNRLGTFHSDTGDIEIKLIERICILDSFVNQNKRNLQTIITTLNYLPTGYYKMPTEQKQVIQSQIDNAVQKYVENYVVPDLDISSEKIKQLESIIQDYEDRLNVVK